MFSLRMRYLLGIALTLLFLAVVIRLTAWAQSETDQHCNMFAEGITLERAFDPNDLMASLEGVELPKTTTSGCYETEAEALCAGTEGTICLPKDATAKDIDWAIRDYEYTVLGGHPDPGPWGWQTPIAQSE